MMNPKVTVTEKQEKAILSLISTSSIREAAQHAGIGQRTLSRWLQDSSFLEAYERARCQIFNKCIEELHKTSSKAVHSLETIMTDQTLPASNRVAAAKAILELSFKGYELHHLSAKLTELEIKIKTFA